jgi:hypothetical protein
MHTGIIKSPFWFLFVVGTLIVGCAISAAAQPPPQNPPSNPARIPPRTTDPMSAEKSSPSDDGPPLTTFEEEMRAKRLIKLAEKEHRENLERAREIAQLAKELQAGFKTAGSLDREGLKRLERLEKLTKKIRGEAGGEADEVQIVNRPSDKSSAISQIAEVADSLSKTVQDTPRQVVAAGVIDSANVLLELIKILRTFL